MADCTWPTGPLFKDHHPLNSFQELGEVAEIIEKYFEGFHGNKVLPSFPKEMQATNNGSLFCRRDVD